MLKIQNIQNIQKNTTHTKRNYQDILRTFPEISQKIIWTFQSVSPCFIGNSSGLSQNFIEIGHDV